MLRRHLLLTAALLPATAARAAVPMWSLVTVEEARRSMAEGPISLPRAIAPPDAPAIVVIAPQDPDKPLVPPVTIRVEFKPQPGSSIVVKTFQALYGFFNIDITSRLLQHAKVTADGLLAENVNIPSGEHEVTLEIADTEGRVGTRTFRFTVA
jgi:hypothetical protein